MARIIRTPGVMNVSPKWKKVRVPTIADTFTRPNSTSIGVTELGDKPWSAGAGWAIVDGTLSAAGLTVDRNALVTSPAPHVEIAATLAAIGSTAATTAGGIMAYYIDGANYAYLSTRSSSTVRGLKFYRVVAGATVAAGTQLDTDVAAGSQIVIGWEEDYQTLSARYNGVVVARMTVTALPATGGGPVGFLGRAGSPTAWSDITITPV